MTRLRWVASCPPQFLRVRKVLFTMLRRSVLVGFLCASVLLCGALILSCLHSGRKAERPIGIASTVEKEVISDDKVEVVKESIPPEEPPSPCVKAGQKFSEAFSSLKEIGLPTHSDYHPPIKWDGSKQKYYVDFPAYASYSNEILVRLAESGDGRASMKLGLEILKNDVYKNVGTGRDKRKVLDEAAFQAGVDYLHKAVSTGIYGSYVQLGHAYYRLSVQHRTDFAREKVMLSKQKEAVARIDAIAWYMLAAEHDVAPERLLALAEMKKTISNLTVAEMDEARKLSQVLYRSYSGYHVELPADQQADIKNALSFDVSELLLYQSCEHGR